MSGAYSFAAEPAPVPAKYRPAGGEIEGGLNIHNDPRVARGSTHGNGAVLGPPALARGKRGAKKKSAPLLRRPDVFGVQPVPKASQQLDLTLHLVEQRAEPETTDASDQTDTFRPKRPVKNYYTRSLPARSGVDAATQIEGGDGLFDFDYEVAPLLSVLVGKTLEAALSEVEEEEELAAIRAAKAGHVADAAAEGARVEAVERAALATHESKRARVAAEARRVAEEEGVRARVLARVQGGLLVAAARADATAALYAAGTFFDPHQRMVEEDFMEQLYRTADAKRAGLVVAGQALDAALGEALRQQRIRQDTWWLAEQARGAAASAVEDPLLPPAPPPEQGALEGLEEGFIRIFLKGAPLGVPDMIGPIAVNGSETLAQTEEKIQAWLVENVGEDFVPPEGGYLKFAVDGNALEPEQTLLDAGVENEATLDVTV